MPFGFEHMQEYRMLLYAWGQFDPTGAIEYCNERASGMGAGFATTGVLEGWASRDPSQPGHGSRALRTPGCPSSITWVWSEGGRAVIFKPPPSMSRLESGRGRRQVSCHAFQRIQKQGLIGKRSMGGRFDRRKNEGGRLCEFKPQVSRDEPGNRSPIG